VLTTVNLGFGVAAVACDPVHGVVLVSDASHGRIVVLSAEDLSQRQVLGGPAAGPGNPLTAAFRMAVDGDRVFVARGISNSSVTVAAVTSLRRQPDGTYVVERNHDFPGAFMQPVAVAVDSGRGLVYVSSLGNPGRPPTLSVLNRSLVQREELVLPRNAHGLAARQGTGLLWAASQAGALLVDGLGGQILRSHPTGPFPFAVTVNRAGTAYVADLIEHTVTKVEAPTEVQLTRFS
jgi:DNA-binding beta-propeller fold protein YncE